MDYINFGPAHGEHPFYAIPICLLSLIAAYITYKIWD
jgi:hypothetical protein